jgi:hypothetical protein
MSRSSHGFKRLVLGLQPSRPDRTVKRGVELANLLDLDLLGLFLDDVGLRQLAGIPFARELRPLGGGWHPIEPERLSRELDLAVRATGRVFAEAAKALSTRHEFEVVRQSVTQAIASLAQPDDILMIAEPSNSADSATQQFLSYSQAALSAKASVMFVPRQLALGTRSVAAIALSADDPSIEAAAAMAVAANEELVVVDARSALDALSRSVKIGPRAGRVGAAPPSAEPAILAHSLPEARARLFVITRGVVTDEMARSTAVLWRTPVLMIEPTDSSRVGAARAGVPVEGADPQPAPD